MDGYLAQKGTDCLRIRVEGKEEVVVPGEGEEEEKASVIRNVRFMLPGPADETAVRN